MKNKTLRSILIVVVVILVILIDFPILSNVKKSIFGRDVTANLGLDLSGGMQVVLQAPEGYQNRTQETLQVASSILENRCERSGR